MTRYGGDHTQGPACATAAGGGKGRTCTVVGCLLIDDGLDYESAIARIAELRAGTRKALEVCPESLSQHRLLWERAARRSF